jgi:hypothetical protein
VFEEDGAAEDVDFASEESASFLVECEVWKGMVGKVEGEACKLVMEGTGQERGHTDSSADEGEEKACIAGDLRWDLEL